MNLIHRMIARRITATAFTVFAVLIGLAATTQVLNQVFRIIDASGGAWIVIQLILLYLPNVAAVTLPLAWLVGLMAAYDTLRENGESLIISGAGRNPTYILRPAFWLSLAVAGLMLFSSLVVEPAANRRLHDLILSLRYEALTLVTGDSVLRELEPGLYVRGGPRDAGGTIDGFLLFDRRAAPEETLYLAESVQLSRDARGVPEVVMDNGRLLMTRDGAATFTAAFGTYRFAPEFFFSDLDVSYRPLELNSGTLLTLVAAQPDNDQAWRELRRRLTDWLYPLMFFAVAAWVTIGAEQTGRGRPGQARWTMAKALALGTAGRVAGLALPGFVAERWGAIAVGIAIPLAIAAVFLVLTMMRAARLRRRIRPNRAAVPA